MTIDEVLAYTLTKNIRASIAAAFMHTRLSVSQMITFESLDIGS